MTGTIKETTANYALGIPYFDVPGWGAAMERDLKIIDAILGLVSAVPGVVGSWQNNTEYVVDDRVVDTDDDTVWTANVSHTSAVTGTFADDRDANPTYWTVVTREIVVRGEIEEGTTYYVGDFVYDEANRLGGVVTALFVATDSLRDNIDDLSIIYDLGAFKLPTVTTALSYLRRNSGNDAYEERTIAQVASDVADDLQNTFGLPTTAASTYLRRADDDSAYEAKTGAEVRQDLGLVVGEDVQAYDADLDTPVSYAEQTLTAAQQGQARANISADLLVGFRNHIINGDFDIAQRGEGPFTADDYTFDRWRLSGGTGSAHSITRSTNNIGDLPNSPHYNLRWQRTTVGSAASVIEQPIENLRKFSGETVTVTVWYTSSDEVPFKVALSASYGTGGSPSSSETLHTTDELTTTSSWQRADFVIDVPDLSAKTFGTNLDDYLALQIHRPLEASGTTLFLGHISLVKGDASAEADPFSPRHPQQELELAQRYYETGTNIWSGEVVSGHKYYIDENFRAVKRVFPGMSVDPDIGNGGIGPRFTNVCTVGGGATAYNRRAFETQNTATGTGEGYYQLNWIADAEF